MKYVVVVNDVWHQYIYIQRTEEDARHHARLMAAQGNEARVYKLVETHYYAARPGHPARTQEPNEDAG